MGAADARAVQRGDRRANAQKQAELDAEAIERRAFPANARDRTHAWIGTGGAADRPEHARDHRLPPGRPTASFR